MGSWIFGESLLVISRHGSRFPRNLFLAIDIPNEQNYVNSESGLVVCQYQYHNL